MLQDSYEEDISWFRRKSLEDSNIIPQDQICHRFANRVQELISDAEYSEERARETAFKEYI